MLVIGIFLPLLVFILSSPNVVDVSGYSNAPTLGDELDKFTATNQTISPHHDMPIGALKIALPQYCPVAFQALPNTLLLDPCILELSRRIVQAIIEDQAGKPDDLATDAPLLTNTEAILSLVPEATHYFTFRSKHLDPRTWSVALIHLRTTCNAIVDAHQYYSVVNKTIVTSGDSVQFPGTPSDPHYFYSRTTVPPIELTRSTGELPHLLYGIQPVVESNDYDVYCLASMNSDLRDLALGWFLMRNTTYAHRAIHQLNTWFINPVSFMQPSSQYAGISTEPNDLDPLKNTLLKFLPLIEIIDSIGLLQDSEYYTWQIARGLKVWFETYLDHLLTSDLGHATARRTDFIANYYMAQIISIASFVGQLPLVREAIELSLANQEDELGKNGVILAAVLMEDATERWTYVTNTLQAHVTIGLQAQHATDIRRMIRPNAYAPTNNLVDDGATTSFGVGSKRRSQSLPSDSDPWIASASVSAAAAASLTIAASLLPPTDRWIFLPDCILYLTDTAYLLHSESISTALEGLHHDEQLTIRAWTQSITLEAIATSNPSLPPMAHRYATVLWQFASIWESPWYQWRSARGASRCLVDINYALPYQCYTLMADRLGPLVRSSPNGWITLGAFAPVRVLPGDVYTETHSVGLFPGVAIFDTNSLPFFLSLGIFGLLRWASFLFRIVPAAFWLCRERRRPKYFKSLRLRAERAVTIIVPTIDSGPELKAAIISWLRNRPKRIIFSTIHKEKAAIVSLLQSCVDMWEEILVRERDQLRTERRAFDVEDDSDLEDDGFRTEVSVLSVGHPNKRQQMVAALTHLDTEIVVFADDDAIWPGQFAIEPDIVSIHVC
ncbi:MAG: alginate lyase family protein [Dehalococcoidales bacterium]|nr:alginate lyase family protein [Dehalococcoidales bacterium]